jgi:hypothetical protein
MSLIIGIPEWLPGGIVYGLGGLALGLLFWKSPTWADRAAVGVLALLWAVSMDGAVDSAAVGVAIGLAAYFTSAGWTRWTGVLWTPLPFLTVWLLEALGRRAMSSQGAPTAPGSPPLRRFLRGRPGGRGLLWLGGMGLGGALAALGIGGGGPTVPAGVGAFVAAEVIRRMGGLDVARPVGLGSLVFVALRWIDAGRAGGYAAVWLTWCVGWVVPSWLVLAWRGWSWESRQRAALWLVALAALGWGWVGYWQESPCRSSDPFHAATGPWTTRDWYGLQVLPVETWQASPAGRAGYIGPPKPLASSGGTCWSVPWTAGQAIATVWEVFRREVCDPTATWRIDFQVVTPAGVRKGMDQEVPVCVWPWMNRTHWTFTAAFPTYLTAEAHEVRICSRTVPASAGRSLEVRLVEARPLPPLLVVERLEVHRRGTHRYRLDVSLWNPGPRRFWGHVLVGLVAADPGREPFRWLGVQRFPVVLGPGDRFRQSVEVTTVRFCGPLRAGIQVVETERGSRGFASAGLSPRGGTSRGSLLPGEPPMCGPSPPASARPRVQPPSPTSCPHTEP